MEEKENPAKFIENYIDLIGNQAYKVHEKVLPLALFWNELKQDKKITSFLRSLDKSDIKKTIFFPYIILNNKNVFSDEEDPIIENFDAIIENLEQPSFVASLIVNEFAFMHFCETLVSLSSSVFEQEKLFKYSFLLLVLTVIFKEASLAFPEHFAFSKLVNKFIKFALIKSTYLACKFTLDTSNLVSLISYILFRTDTFSFIELFHN